MAGGDWAVVHEAETAEEAFSMIRKIDPRWAIICHPAITQWANAKYAPVQEPYVSRHQFLDEKLPKKLVSWRDNQLLMDMADRPQSLILWGSTRLGKTQWACSLGTHNYFNSNFNFKQWDPDAKLCIIDDFRWEYFKHDHHHFVALKVLLWGQEQVDMTDKYMPKFTIKGMPCIFICNELPAIFSDSNWEKNVIVQHVRNKLY